MGRAHVDPDALLPGALIILPGLGSELRGGERQHVLAALQERLPGHIVLLAASAVFP